MKKWPVVLLMVMTLLFAVAFLTAGKASDGTIQTDESSDLVAVRFMISDSEIQEVTLEPGSVITAPPAVSSEDFLGWYVKGDTSRRIVDTSQLTVYNNLTLQASYS